MARQARKDSETSIYHVMMRGNNKEPIFRRSGQKLRLKEYIDEECADDSLKLIAWCIMDNHVHLVFKGNKHELSQAIKRINTRFAMGFNTIEKRVGHVFQDRFKSEPVNDDNHLLAVIRYVHNNPVKANLVARARDYEWSSYSEYIRKQNVLSSKNEQILSYFNGDLEKFEFFHAQQDDEEFLDMKEDIEQNRLDKAEQVISSFCIARGVIDSKQIKGDVEALNELIIVLIEKSKLPYRKIAALLEIPYSRICQVVAKGQGL